MKTLITLFLSFLGLHAFSQDGLEGIFVERYYTSQAADNGDTLNSGNLAVGSVTYRIYVDLKPGFTFQAAFGSPQHPLFIKSTAPFFNHADAGTVIANILPERTLGRNISLLDSWLSVGAAGENHLAVPKAYDPDGIDSLIKWSPLFLKAKEGKKTISLQQADGMIRVENTPFPTLYQIEPNLRTLGSATLGQELVVENGAWASMGKGSMGADSLTTNSVLIAQITTTGELSFELNLLIGAPNGTSQRYVARNPDLGEWVHPDLIFSPSLLDKHLKKKKKSRNKKTKTNTPK